MAKIIDLSRRKESKRQILEGNLNIPDLESLQNAPLLKKHRLLMKEFPNGQFDSDFEQLDPVLSSFSKPEEKTKIARIHKLMKEIQILNKEISINISTVYATCVKGEVHIQEMYVDLNSKVKDTPRMESRIAGLQKVQNDINDHLKEELNTGLI